MNLPELEDVLRIGFWCLKRPNGDIRASQIRFGEGIIIGYSTPNERSWAIQEGRLVFLDGAGTVTAAASFTKRNASNLLEVTMVYPHNSERVAHVLEQIDPTADGLRYPFKLQWKKSFESFFVQNRIFLRHVMQVDGVWKEGDQFLFNKQVLVEPYATMPARAFCSMGCHSYSTSTLSPDVRIGRYCSIAPNVTIMGTQHPISRFTSSPATYDPRFIHIAARDFGQTFKVHPFQAALPPPIIGHDVWIGEDTKIKGDIKIGNGAIVAARSVVTRDVEPFSVVGGTPARIIKMRFSSDVIRRLEHLKPWQYNFVDWPQANFTNIDLFLNDLEDLVMANLIQPYNPPVFDIAYELLELSLLDID